MVSDKGMSILPNSTFDDCPQKKEAETADDALKSAAVAVGRALGTLARKIRVGPAPSRPLCLFWHAL